MAYEYNPMRAGFKDGMGWIGAGPNAVYGCPQCRNEGIPILKLLKVAAVILLFFVFLFYKLPKIIYEKSGEKGKRNVIIYFSCWILVIAGCVAYNTINKNIELEKYQKLQEERQNRDKEISQAVGTCGDNALCLECQKKAFANYGGDEAKKQALDCQNKYKQKLKECELSVEKKYEEEKKPYEKEQRKLKKEWDEGQSGKTVPFPYTEGGLRFRTMSHMRNCMKTLSGYDLDLEYYGYNYDDIVYYLYTEEELN